MSLGHVGPGDWGNMVGDGGNMVAEGVGTCRIATWDQGIGGIWSEMGAIWSQRVLVHVA